MYKKYFIYNKNIFNTGKLINCFSLYSIIYLFISKNKFNYEAKFSANIINVLILNFTIYSMVTDKKPSCLIVYY